MADPVKAVIREKQILRAALAHVGPAGPPGPAGASEWGDIGGTLADQLDLQAALDAITIDLSAFADGDIPYYSATNEVLEPGINWLNALLSVDGKIYLNAGTHNSYYKNTIWCDETTRITVQAGEGDDDYIYNYVKARIGLFGDSLQYPSYGSGKVHIQAGYRSAHSGYSHVGSIMFLVNDPYQVAGGIYNTGQFGIGTPFGDTDTYFPSSRLEILDDGGQLLGFTGEDSIGDIQNAAAMRGYLADATAASFLGRLQTRVYDYNAPESGRVAMEIGTTGSAPKIGFLGAASAARQPHINDPTDLSTALTAIASIIDILETFGFSSTS